MSSMLLKNVCYNGFQIPTWGMDYIKQRQDFEVREDDIFIDCFPKSGTTWMQQIVYLIVHGLDYDDQAGSNIEERVPYMEFLYPGLENIKACKGQRILKTHMSYTLLPPPVHEGKAKVVCMVRNPKDVAVSCYHFCRMNVHVGYEGDFLSFYQLFIDDTVFYAPYTKYLEEFWQHRHDKNILFLFYEDMQLDLASCVKSVSQFLQRDLSEQQLTDIVNRCTFKSMKDDPSCNYSWWDELGNSKLGEAKFMRKGVVGDWKNYFTEEMSSKMDQIYAPLEKLGLKFKYEI